MRHSDVRVKITQCVVLKQLHCPFNRTRSFLPLPPFSHHLPHNGEFRCLPNWISSSRLVMTCEFHPMSALLSIAEAEALVSTAIKVLSPESQPHNQMNDGILPQYYALAAGTILFYDYLLMLPDEVRGNYYLSILQFHAEIALKIKYFWSRPKSWCTYATWNASSLLLILA